MLLENVKGRYGKKSSPKKQIIDEPGVKVIDISFDFESVVGTKLSNTGFVLHLLRSK